MKSFKYLLYYITLPAVIAIICNCGSAKMDLTPRDINGNKIVHDLPKLPDSMPPGMAKVQTQNLVCRTEGSNLICVLRITEVEAISETAPPLKVNKIIEVEFPKIIWLRFNKNKQPQPEVDEALRMSIIYAGKAVSEEASTAWHLKRFFK